MKNEKRPIIIKKITAAHHGHHGGAWKVAYADFVTAMMAFFLLLWLLNSMPQEKLTGIADYFEPTIGISGEKGIGFSGGTQNEAEGAKSGSNVQGFKYGVPKTGPIVSIPTKDPEVSNEELDNERFASLEDQMNQSFAQDPSMQGFKDAIQLVQTPEGLSIEIKDQEKYPMFEQGSAELTSHARNILGKISKFLIFSPNFISISGHTDKSFAASDAKYTNWELSSDRANAARRYLVENGIADDQIARIIGRADSDPISNNPYAAENRRISIVLLRNTIAPYHKVSAPKEVLSGASGE